MREVKLRRPRVTDEERKQILQDYQDDMPLKEILKKHNVAKTTVYNILKEQIN